jgi:uncharacterized protein
MDLGRLMRYIVFGLIFAPAITSSSAHASGTNCSAQKLANMTAQAEHGDKFAQGRLAARYYAGDCVRADYATAFKWFRKAAQQGEPISQYFLGLMLLKGDGAAKNSHEAARWFRKSADQGEPSAEAYMGMCYEYGTGVIQDYAEAMKWYRKADADQAVPSSLAPEIDIARVNLGSMYFSGEGTPKDEAEGVQWFRKAAEHGFPEGQTKLGLAYLLGTGVPQDYVQAHMWLNLAASSGDAVAAQARDDLAEKMTPQEIEQAQSLARDWSATHSNVQ